MIFPFLQSPEEAKAEAMKIIMNQEIENRLKKLGVKIVPCRKCGQEMFWLTTKRDNRAPVTMQLLNHFADCPYAKEFKKQTIA